MTDDVLSCDKQMNSFDKLHGKTILLVRKTITMPNVCALQRIRLFFKGEYK